MSLHQQQGLKLRHEAKQAFTRFFEDYKRLQRSYERVQEIATDKRVDEISIKDIKRKMEFIRKLREIENEYDNADENTKEFVHYIFDIIEAITYSSSLQEYELWMGRLKHIVEELSERTKAQ